MISASAEDFPAVVARFWAKVQKQDGDGCWLWTDSKTRRGYGRLRVRRRHHHAHRLAWLIHTGKPPGAKMVLHRCDNRACVRPDHLFLGTAADNAADRDAKGRGGRGSAMPRAVLTEPAVLAILQSREPQRVLAARYGVDQSAISKVRRRVSWRHITEARSAA